MILNNHWQTSKRKIPFRERALVMGILNVTPDSFSDGGEFFSIENALERAARLVDEGADIIDIGGESTRPSSDRVSVEEEIRRVVPTIEKICEKFDVPVSIDTTKSEVAERALAAGAEIVNDISGLRFDERIAEVAALKDAGLILMHSRGDFERMHKQSPVENIVREVADGFHKSIETAGKYGVGKNNIALDVGVGFSKTFENNLELLGKLSALVAEFADFPMLVGASRKSFVGKILGGAPASERLNGSLAAAVVAVWNGANIVRVHDVRETVEAVKVIEAVRKHL